jgi:cytochrome c oxidase subunit 2
MFDWFPKNISTYGGEIDGLFWLIFWFSVVWFVAAEGVIFYFIFSGRRKSGKKATYVTGETKKQLTWILVLGVIVTVLDLAIDFAGAHAYDKVKAEVPETDYVVEVIGKQFNWIFNYPGPDKIFGTDDDLTVENELHVPANKTIHTILKSEDVIHSFFIPVMRMKQDLIPGRDIDAWFESTETSENTENGYYEIACAELCGYAHYTMRGFLYVHSPEDYEKWVAEQWAPKEEESLE